MSGSDKQRALRLIALCYLAMYQTEKAEAYAQKLILENRYYSNVDDPIEFAEIINKLKAGYTTTDNSYIIAYNLIGKQVQIKPADKGKHRIHLKLRNGWRYKSNSQPAFIKCFCGV